MRIDLTETNASAIASALLSARRRAGSPAMGMVLTLVVVTDEGPHEDAMRAARAVSTEHPARILGVIRGESRGRPRLDAEVSIGSGTSGETVLLRMTGPLTAHSESVVTPLLLPDSPVVVWWPAKAPDDPAHDPLGALAQRRLTDSAAVTRGRGGMLARQAENYADGNTDLAWTRLTPWRALLAAALDQHPVRVQSAEVVAQRGNPSADLLAAWLSCRLHVDVDQRTSSGPGITEARLSTRHGEIAITRPDGRLARFRIPGEADRPVALKRREVPELLAEELRRLDPDDIYAETVRELSRRFAQKSGSRRSASGSRSTARRSGAAKSGTRKSTASKSTSRKSTSRKSAARKSTRTSTQRRGSARTAARSSSRRSGGSGGATRGS